MADNSSFYKQILLLENKIFQGLSNTTFLGDVKKSLEDFDFASFQGMNTLRECLPLTRSVTQYYSPTGFGKSNLTLVNNGRFCILLMYMDDLSTEIHNHPFEGVFTPLKGSPVQLSFTFETHSKVNEFLEVGNLVCSDYKVLPTYAPVTISKEMIHMLERPKGEQFSLLILRSLEKEYRKNSFYLYPGLKLYNRDGYSYLSRIISTFQSTNHLEEEPIRNLLGSLEVDELIQLYFRVGPELASKSMTQEEIQFIRNYAKKELTQSRFWEYVEKHSAFLKSTKEKVSVLVR